MRTLFIKCRAFVFRDSLVDKLTVALLPMKRKKNRTQTKIAVDTDERRVKIRFMSERTFQQMFGVLFGGRGPKRLIVRLL